MRGLRFCVCHGLLRGCCAIRRPVRVRHMAFAHRHRIARRVLSEIVVYNMSARHNIFNVPFFRKLVWTRSAPEYTTATFITFLFARRPRWRGSETGVYLSGLRAPPAPLIDARRESQMVNTRRRRPTAAGESPLRTALSTRSRPRTTTTRRPPRLFGSPSAAPSLAAPPVDPPPPPLRRSRCRHSRGLARRWPAGGRGA